MGQLIEIENRDGVKVVESRIIAKGLGIKHKNLLETINKHKDIIESKFGRLAFETLNVPVAIPNTKTQRIDEVTVIWLNEKQVNFIGTLSRNSEKVVEFKALMVEAFDAYKLHAQNNHSELPATPSPARITLMLAQQMVEAEEKILMLENRTAELEAKLATSETDYYTVAGYGKLAGIHLTNTEAGPLGKEVTKLSKQLGYNIGKVRDPRFGHVNTYHVDILKQLIRKQVA